MKHLAKSLLAAHVKHTWWCDGTSHSDQPTKKFHTPLIHKFEYIVWPNLPKFITNSKFSKSIETFHSWHIYMFQVYCPCKIINVNKQSLYYLPIHSQSWGTIYVSRSSCPLLIAPCNYISYMWTINSPSALLI